MATSVSSSAHVTHNLAPDAIDELRNTIGGALLELGHPAFESARTLWNGMISARPALIAQPTGVSDVMHLVIFARQQNLEIAIKGGGHNVAGYATTSGGLMIDLERMRNVRVDPERRTARAGGGARWADFDREASVFGLATTGGVISTTGVGGLTLGGGVGWLIGKHGLASDNLLSVDLVTADGEFVTASESSHPELFWALRGGGGNFGVATSLEFQLHPQERVYAGMVAHPPDMADEVLRFYREFTASAPEELTVYCGQMAEPEEGQRVAAMAFCWSGAMDQAETVLRPLLEFGPPMLTMAGPMPYAVWNGANDALFPHGRHYYWKSAMLRELDDAVLETVAEFGRNAPLPWLNITVESYRGGLSRRSADATAFPHRDARYQIVIIGAWDDPAQEAIGTQWARDLHAAVEPHAMRGDFLNFTALDGADRQQRIRAGYGRSWDRLVEVKRRYDPDNVFHRNNTITP